MIFKNYAVDILKSNKKKFSESNKKKRRNGFTQNLEKPLSNQKFLFFGNRENFLLNQQIKSLHSSIRNKDVLSTMWTFFIKSTYFL